MKIKLSDIAELTGLNISTVSRALNDNPRISQETRDLVKKIAKEKNYIMNEHASFLARKKNNRIGIIFPKDFFAFNKRDFFSKIEENFLKLSEKSKYEISLIRSNDVEKVIGGSYIDGLIIANRDILEKNILDLDKNNIPYIFLAYKPSFKKNDESINVFKSDNIKSGYEVAKYLFDKGCKSLLTITSRNKFQTDYVDRTEGFLKFCTENRDKLEHFHVEECNMTFQDGKNIVEERREELLKFDGIFCQEDKVALGILSSAEKNNIKVPEDFSLVGFDNLELINYFEPKLTTVEENFYEICSNALKYLINTIEGLSQKEVKFLINTKIVEGDS